MELANSIGIVGAVPASAASIAILLRRRTPLETKVVPATLSDG
jgi:hypothetical protein